MMIDLIHHTSKIFLNCICKILKLVFKMSKTALFINTPVLLMVAVCLFILIQYFCRKTQLQEIGLLDFITVQYFLPTTLHAPILKSCAFQVPNIRSADINVKMVKFYETPKESMLQSPVHRLFFPALNKTEKLHLLHTYFVLLEAMENAEVEHFIESGTLLGLYRHQGMIPWDDAIHIAVSISDWKSVRNALSCINGFTLNISQDGSMHWKFYSNINQGFPFVDIFFYVESRNFVFRPGTWAYRKKDVFPLKAAQFEGLIILVPRNWAVIVKKQYDVSLCSSRTYEHDHKTGRQTNASKVASVPCKSLSYIYVI